MLSARKFGYLLFKGSLVLSRQKFVCHYFKLKDKTRVEVIEVLPPFKDELKNKVLSFLEENARDGYKGNYVNNASNDRTAAYLFESGAFAAVYLCFINDELSYFSGIREVDGELMLGVRLLAKKNKGDSRPFHPAYVIPVQIERARLFGYTKCFASYNVGVKTSFYEMILKLQKSKSTEEVTRRASDVVKQFRSERIKTINNTSQFYLGLNTCDFKPPQEKS